MGRVPLVGRLFWREYLALVGSLSLVILESLVRLITFGLPPAILQFFYNQSRATFNRFSRHSSDIAASSPIDSIGSRIAAASSFAEICELHGYYAEEHIVRTKDGYLLGLHRFCKHKVEEERQHRAGRSHYHSGKRRPVVYLHHGLLMNSDAWVCLTEQERCLPIILVEKGYDVWLGNNRGNKYSKKSTRFSPSTRAFWDFSIDQFAFYDIPDSIDYILSLTEQRSLSYIGFSQGTAQAFAALSIHPALNDKINVFVALAPAMSPAGLRNGVVDSLVKASPEILFLAFGRRSLLASTPMWQSILYPPVFVRILDIALSFLFDWSAKNIDPAQKLAAYPHLYSFSSTKSIVHWFQIIRNKSFQMFDDEVQAPLSVAAVQRYYRVAKFPTKNIKTPILLLYGGSDSLVDINVMLKELPRHTIATEVAKYEHLDFLWAEDVHTLVFPSILAALAQHAETDHSAIAMNGIRLSPIPDGIDMSRSSTPLNLISEHIAEEETSANENSQGTKFRGRKRASSRSTSVSSCHSFDGHTKFAHDGISVGASKAIVGMVRPKS